MKIVLPGLLISLPVWAAQKQKKSEPQSSSSSKTTGGADEQGNPVSDSEPNYNPFHAAQDVEVGEFYLHKGDADAAIDRFKDAIRLRPDYAKPRLLLGQAYEKKRDKTSALKYYKEYLQVLPEAVDREKVKKKIAKLSRE